MTDHHHRHDAASRPLPPTPTEAERIALAAAKEASRQTVNELFSDLGISVDNREQVGELREDLLWVRRLRTGSRTAGTRFMMTLVTVAAGAIAVSLWETFKAAGAYLLHILHITH
jgi:hypothetical protein